MRRSTILLVPAVILACASINIAAGRPQHRFTYHPLHVGDRAVESLRFILDMKIVLTQQGQVVGTVDQTINRDEHSTVVRLAPAASESVRAQITYDMSQQNVTVGRGGLTKAADLPVAGKTYLVARVGDELQITDAAGARPPDDERAIVARSLDALGKPNPLGLFFNGRTIAEGEIVRLPAEFTDRLLSSFDDTLAGVPLDVMLMGTERVDGALCGLFHTPPAGSANPRGEQPAIDGKFLIELATCRVAGIEIRGPVSAVERRGAPGQEFDRRRKGKVHVALHIEHQRAAR